jgi:nucleoside-diphosphate-sugar epimerase
MLTSKVAQALALSGDRIVITGAGGWLGLATLDMLERALGPELGGRVCCFGSSSRGLLLRSGTRVQQRPLDGLAELERRPTLLMHLAFLTKDRAESMTESAYVEANRALSQHVLGALDRIGVTGLFVASSGAAAVADDPSQPPAMRLYGRLKRADEEMFESWARETGARAAIARIFNLSGPYINKPDRYALASFIVDALAERPIEIRAPRRVVRGYVAVEDLVALAFSILLDGGRGALLFETGGEPVDLEAVAHLVSEQLGNVPVHRASITDERPDAYVGDHQAWCDLLEHYGLGATTLAEQVRQTIAFLSGQLAGSNGDKRGSVSARTMLAGHR